MAEPEQKVIPFYGNENVALFAIERKAMDRDGILLSWLDGHLPSGLVLDVGAGNGFTARKLTRSDRTILPIEPSPGMVGTRSDLPFVRSVAQELPFDSDTFDSAYATWAYFFPQMGHAEVGLAELDRVVRAGGAIFICDNAGSDEFCGLFERDISSNRRWWEEAGFDTTILESSFRFDSVEEAEELLGYYWSLNGKSDNAQPGKRVGFHIAVYSRTAGRRIVT